MDQKRKRIVVLSGAGISAESGISTFRDSGGLWEQYDIMEVATYNAWLNNMELVLEFYNQRRKQLLDVQPNAAHYALKELEAHFEVRIITQNVDDLHERAGSGYVLHLHGELRKSRSTLDENLIYDIQGWQLNPGDLCEKGAQLRPHIVWFGEPVPMMPKAARLAESADIFIIVGTSLNVYPAAGLVDYVRPGAAVYVVDPGEMDVGHIRGVHFMQEKAGEALPKLVKHLIAN